MERVKHANAAAARRYYSHLFRAGKLAGTIAAALKKWSQRQLSSTSAKPARLTWKLAWLRCQARKLATGVVVPLGADTERRAVDDARKQLRRLQEWSHGARATIAEPHTFTTGSNTNWNKRSTFRRGVAVRSLARGTWREIEYTLTLLSGATVTVQLRAPRGYRWDFDGDEQHVLMLRTVRRRGRSTVEYHPTSDELLVAANDKCRALVAQIKSARAARATARAVARAQVRDAALIRSLLPEIKVTAWDARRSGSCAAGVKMFAADNGADASDPYAGITAARLQDIAARDPARSARINAAIAAAVSRATLVTI